jgi:hypothetical protein
MLVGASHFPYECDSRVWNTLGTLRTLLQSMLKRDPAARPSIGEEFETVDIIHSPDATPASAGGAGVQRGDISTCDWYANTRQAPDALSADPTRTATPPPLVPPLDARR